LHFGGFGGLTVKILYGLLGLALTVVTHTGVTIWLARRRDKGRPAPHWERVWAGVVWGQPLALAAAVFPALFLNEKAILPIYLVIVVAALAFASRMSSAEGAARVLKWATGVLVCAAVVAHAAVWGAQVSDPMAWGVSAVAMMFVLVPVVIRRSWTTLEARSGA